MMMETQSIGCDDQLDPRQSSDCANGLPIATLTGINVALVRTLSRRLRAVRLSEEIANAAEEQS